MKFLNIFYFFKKDNMNRDKYFKRLEYEFCNKSKDILKAYDDVLNLIFNFKLNKNALGNSFKIEMEDLVIKSNEIVEEAIIEENNQIKKNIKNQEFEDMKEEMKKLHAVNEEIFKLNKRMKDEKDLMKKKNLEIEQRKKEEKLKLYYDSIKMSAIKFKDDKLEEKIQLEIEKEVIKTFKK